MNEYKHICTVLSTNIIIHDLHVYGQYLVSCFLFKIAHFVETLIPKS